MLQSWVVLAQHATTGHAAPCADGLQGHVALSPWRQGLQTYHVHHARVLWKHHDGIAFAAALLHLRQTLPMHSCTISQLYSPVSTRLTDRDGGVWHRKEGPHILNRLATDEQALPTTCRRV